ncbi:MAG: hypothetical protein WA988_16730, partial [Candidatus Nanopelagicales bacterium]
AMSLSILPARTSGIRVAQQLDHYVGLTSPRLSWVHRHCREIIAAETPEQIEAFIDKYRSHRSGFSEDEIQGLREGSLREAVKDWFRGRIRARQLPTWLMFSASAPGLIAPQLRRLVGAAIYTGRRDQGES